MCYCNICNGKKKGIYFHIWNNRVGNFNNSIPKLNLFPIVSNFSREEKKEEEEKKRGVAVEWTDMYKPNPKPIGTYISNWSFRIDFFCFLCLYCILRLLCGKCWYSCSFYSLRGVFFCSIWYKMCIEKLVNSKGNFFLVRNKVVRKIKKVLIL